MNKYKIERIKKHIQKDKLPTDRWGQILNVDDLIIWYGLDRCLDENEKECVKVELALMAEAELLFMEQFK